MKIKRSFFKECGENMYLLSGETGAAIVDPGCVNRDVEEFIEQNREKELAILITHCHFDHISGVAEIVRRTGAKVYVSETEKDSLSDPVYALYDRCELVFDPAKPDVLLRDGQSFSVGDLRFTAFATPGHTRGSLCYLCDGYLFSGDTLFLHNIGRTDFTESGGNPADMEASLEKLASLPQDVVVYPGHGLRTSLFREKEENPWMNGMKPV